MCFFVAAIAAFSTEERAAQAHAAFNPSRNNRYVKVSLTGGGHVRIAYAILYGEAPASAVRRKADLDGNGVLDEREIATCAAQAQAAVSAGLAVEVDGERRSPSWEPPVPGLSDAHVGPIPFSIDLAGTVTVRGPGPHVVRLDDATPMDDLGETEVRIEEGPGTRVLQAWQSRDDGGRQMRYLWNGPKFSILEDRSVGLRFVDDTAAKQRRRPLPIAIGGMLVAAIAAVVLLRRSRPRPRPEGRASK